MRFDTFHILRVFPMLLLAIALVTTSCSRELDGCGGPELDSGKVLGVQQNLYASGPEASLVLPNPVDATGINLVSATDSRVLDATSSVALADLSTSSRLENSFLKIRHRSLVDQGTDIAQPNASGKFDYDLQDQRYSQAMAYHSIRNVSDYVESLGFTLNKTKPLYVMVRSTDDPTDPNSTKSTSGVNAFYIHSKEDPSSPRMIQIHGDTQYSLGIDRDTFWHEFGHFVNESVSNDVGFDDATTFGASFVQSRAIHECVADYLSESLGDKGYIGKWGARNFAEVPKGEPLRSAISKNDDKNDYSKVALNDGADKYPEAYRMAEWCSRVLWDFRSQFKKEDTQSGSLFADRVVLSSLGFLPKDASMKQFFDALKKSDEELHCGLHSRSIQSALQSRGFNGEYTAVSSPIALKAAAIGVNPSGDSFAAGRAGSGSVEVFFSLELLNSNSGIARNVRVQLESDDPAVVPVTYLQGFGDIVGGKTIKVGNTIDALYSSVSFSFDTARLTGKKSVKVRLRVLVENGPVTVKTVEVPL